MTVASVDLGSGYSLRYLRWAPVSGRIVALDYGS